MSSSRKMDAIKSKMHKLSGETAEATAKADRWFQAFFPYPSSVLCSKEAACISVTLSLSAVYDGQMRYPGHFIVEPSIDIFREPATKIENPITMGFVQI